MPNYTHVLCDTSVHWEQTHLCTQIIRKSDAQWNKMILLIMYYTKTIPEVNIIAQILLFYGSGDLTELCFIYI